MTQFHTNSSNCVNCAVRAIGGINKKIPGAEPRMGKADSFKGHVMGASGITGCRRCASTVCHLHP